MKIELKLGFDFGKSIASLKSTIEKKTSKAILPTIVTESKNLIKSGNVKGKLEDSTLEIRRKRGRTGSKPLFETGELAKSIRLEKNSITYAPYGKYHRQKNGYTTSSRSMIPNRKVPQREFISWFVDKKSRKRIMKDIRPKIVKLIKESWRK